MVQKVYKTGGFHSFGTIVKTTSFLPSKCDAIKIPQIRHVLSLTTYNHVFTQRTKRKGKPEQ